MLTIKQKVSYLEKRAKEFLDKEQKNMPFQQKLVVNATFNGLTNMIKTTKPEKLEAIITTLHAYLTEFLKEHKTVEDLEESLDAVNSNGH